MRRWRRPALIGDAEFFEWLEANRDGGLCAAAQRASARSPRACAFKARTVAADERETGERALLNLGHTFAHALEAACGFDAKRLVHGEAVSIGIVLAHDFSVAEGLAPAGRRGARAGASEGRRAAGRDRATFPARRFRPDELMRHIAQDKKVKRGRLTFILTRGIGKHSSPMTCRRRR